MIGQLLGDLIQTRAASATIAMGSSKLATNLRDVDKREVHARLLAYTLDKYPFSVAGFAASPLIPSRSLALNPAPFMATRESSAKVLQLTRLTSAALIKLLLPLLIT